jgi:hypothetical protein
MTRASRTEWTAVAAAVGVAAVLVFGLRTAVVRDASRPNVEFFPDMVRGPAVQSQTDGVATTDGFSDIALPEGVVVRGTSPFHYGATPEEAERAGRELTSPSPPTTPRRASAAPSSTRGSASSATAPTARARARPSCAACCRRRR